MANKDDFLNGTSNENSSADTEPAAAPEPSGEEDITPEVGSEDSTSGDDTEVSEPAANTAEQTSDETEESAAAEDGEVKEGKKKPSQGVRIRL